MTARSSPRSRTITWGGNTNFCGAALFRLRPQDFGVIEHHGGLSPARALSHQDLEPYYAEGGASILFTARSGRIRPRGRAAAIPPTRRCRLLARLA
jgi:hypothetical protein